MLWKILIGLGALLAGVWAFNTSLFTAPAEDARTRILSHRGVYQTYHKEDLGVQDCTATRIYEPTHSLLENTIPSIRAAFAAGADVVEIDVHITKDKNFAVFHDWDAECRTGVTGKIETFTSAELKTLDIGHGYTHEGGETFPFRGQYAGQMLMLDEVFDAFPDGRFLVNLKSNSLRDGEVFADLVLAHSRWAENIAAFYGGPRAIAAASDKLPAHIGFSRQSTTACLKDYVLWGWTGQMPERCHKTQILVPMNYAPYLWGWPHKFTNRMRAVGSTVYLAGSYEGRRAGSDGINTLEIAAKVPDNFDGFVWTDRVEEIAPYLAARD